MNISLYTAFLIAAAALILLPGPTVMLVTSKSLRYGVNAGLVAVAGSTSAAAIQLLIVVAGLASFAVFLSDLFEWIRWIGVAYLIYLGVKTWLDSMHDDTSKVASSPSTFSYRDFADGFLMTLTNPKTLLFHGAFLPQFVDATIPALPQLMILSGSFLIVAAVLDSCWALLAARLGKLLKGNRSRKYADRISGSILIGAGATLALIRRAE